jgi:hypothetical protein
MTDAAAGVAPRWRVKLLRVLVVYFFQSLAVSQFLERHGVEYTPNAMLEKDVLRLCMDYLRANRVFCWRANQIPAPLAGGGFRRFSGMRGVSDIIGILPGGRFLAVEIKRSSGGKLSEDQEEFLDTVNEIGGVGLVVRSIEELQKDLAQFL